MKFEKFVKSLASSGVIYNQQIGDLPINDRWLASPSVFMKIPVTVKSVTAAAIQEMPKAISKMIDQIGHTEYAELAEAISRWWYQGLHSGLQDQGRHYLYQDQQ